MVFQLKIKFELKTALKIFFYKIQLFFCQVFNGFSSISPSVFNILQIVLKFENIKLSDLEKRPLKISHTVPLKLHVVFELMVWL